MQTDPLPGQQPAPESRGVLQHPEANTSPEAAAPAANDPGNRWTLEQLEADIAAVGSAMETVDRIVAGVGSGEGSVGSAAAEIEAVVSPERFGTEGDQIPR